MLTKLGNSLNFLLCTSFINSKRSSSFFSLQPCMELGKCPQLLVVSTLDKQGVTHLVMSTSIPEPEPPWSTSLTNPSLDQSTTPGGYPKMLLPHISWPTMSQLASDNFIRTRTRMQGILRSLASQRLTSLGSVLTIPSVIWPHSWYLSKPHIPLEAVVWNQFQAWRNLSLNKRKCLRKLWENHSSASK
jgi:hypothetical protein